MRPTCQVEGCQDTINARGLCHTHYKQILRAGLTAAPPRVRGGHPTPYAAALGDWIQQAACADHDPDLWFPPGRTHMSKRAVQICLDCPVIRECDRAIHATPPTERWGIWAGKYYGGA